MFYSYFYRVIFYSTEFFCMYYSQVQAVTFLLTSEDLDVRLAAGKALALLIDYQRGAADEEDVSEICCSCCLAIFMCVIFGIITRGV